MTSSNCWKIYLFHLRDSYKCNTSAYNAAVKPLQGFFCIFLHNYFNFQSIVKWQTYTHTLSAAPASVLSTALSSGLYLLSVMLGEEVLGGYRDREIREKKAVRDERWMTDEVWLHSSIPFPSYFGIHSPAERKWSCQVSFLPWSLTSTGRGPPEAGALLTPWSSLWEWGGSYSPKDVFCSSPDWDNDGRISGDVLTKGVWCPSITLAMHTSHASILKSFHLKLFFLKPASLLCKQSASFE